jgi:hypothetical protein
LASCGGGVPEAAGPSEGIQVHGDWTIDVYNPDGSLDQHVEFSNALTVFGARTLAQLVSGNASEGDWQILLLAGSSDPAPCPSNSLNVGACAIGPIFGVWTSGEPSFTVAGSTVIESNALIVSVETRVGICNPDIAPNSCAASTSSTSFTSKVLDVADRVEVTAGQTVQAQVEISFTSG